MGNKETILGSVKENKMDIIDQIEYKGFNINIRLDDYPESPRDWDNLGIMACWHDGYTLGDIEKQHPELYLYDLVEDYYNTELVEKWYCDMDRTDFIEHCIDRLQRFAIVLPLYLLDHSGLWMSTGRFPCDSGGWDTSHVGFIFLTFKRLKEELARPKYKEGKINPDLEPIKHITKQDKERAIKCLINEVQIYSDYLSGTVYGYNIEPIEDTVAIVCEDSCYGFYGNEFDKNGLLEYAQNSIDCSIKNHREEG